MRSRFYSAQIGSIVQVLTLKRKFFHRRAPATKNAALTATLSRRTTAPAWRRRRRRPWPRRRLRPRRRRRRRPWRPAPRPWPTWPTWMPSRSASSARTWSATRCSDRADTSPVAPSARKWPSSMQWKLNPLAWSTTTVEREILERWTHWNHSRVKRGIFRPVLLVNQVMNLFWTFPHFQAAR